MLESISLRNFQCHEKETVNLSPILTVIVGPNDVGKSAFLRALRWVSFNKPSGDGFLRRGEDTVQVKLAVDKREVERGKGKKNYYQLGAKEFVSFGQGNVPEEVANLLDLSPANLQLQLELHFWFSKTPGEVSRELNGIVNLDLIDGILSDVGSELREAKQEVNLCKTRLDKARQERTQLSWVKELEEDLKELEELEVRQKEEERILTQLTQLAETYSIAHSEYEQSSQLANELERLYTVAQELQEQESDIERLERFAAALEQANGILEHSIPLNEVNDLLSSYDFYCDEEKELEKLQEIATTLQDAEEEQCRCEQAAVTAEKELKKLIGEECPLCGNPAA